MLLIASGPMGWCVADAMARRFDGLMVIAEEPESKLTIVRRRIRLRGWFEALGQVGCGLLLRGLEPLAARRREELCSQLDLRPRPDAGLDVCRVPSVNSEACRVLLRELAPAVVAVYGTRIIAPATLASVAVPFINYHAGINPKYRGQHPAYWALCNGDPENAGVTVHLVDKGVDTGAVLYQSTVKFSPGDTIQTYQWAQLPAGTALLARAIEDALAHRLSPYRVELPDAQYFPPTLWRYLWNGVSKRVW